MSAAAKESLLDHLSNRLRCNYLSDLHLMPYCGRIPAIIRSIPPDAFPLWQWNDAIEYLLQLPAAFQTAVDAKSFILETYAAAMPVYKKEQMP